jgi:hypothetical protein
MRQIWIALFVVASVTPVTIPAQSNCRDGRTSRASGRGTCSHHGGVASRPEPAPTRAGSPGDITLPSQPSAPTSLNTRERTTPSYRDGEQASVKVWVNTNSGVYHCPGTRWYGVTKNGEYMSESQARASGDRPAYGRSCS